MNIFMIITQTKKTVKTPKQWCHIFNKPSMSAKTSWAGCLLIAGDTSQPTFNDIRLGWIKLLKTGDCDNGHTAICSLVNLHRGIISSIFVINSEAFASEFLANLEEMFLRCYKHSNLFSTDLFLIFFNVFF